MLKACAFCDLVGKGENATFLHFAEALEHIAKLFINKEAQEELKVQQNEAIVKEANKTIENLKVANKLMAMEVEKLKVAFEDAQQRGDCYKKKFLKIQEELIQMHKSNKKFSKTCSISAEQQRGNDKSNTGTNTERTVQPVVLAPDTCFANTPLVEENCFKQTKNVLISSSSKENFQKSSKKIPIYQLFESKNQKKNTALHSKEAKSASFSKIDPDVTRLDRSLWNEQDDDEMMLSIPASPVSSAKFIANKKSDTHLDDECMKDINESPSLLPPAQNFKIEQAMLEGHIDTSIDELFNKTDGVLMKSILDSIPAHYDGIETLDQIETKRKIGQKEQSMAEIITSASTQAGCEKKSPEIKVQEKANTKLCSLCVAYYRDLPDDERDEILPKVCHHYSKSPPPATPNHFWDIGIPNTAECRKRGYIRDEKDLSSKEQQEAGFRRRRRKPYQAHFPTKKS